MRLDPRMLPTITLFCMMCALGMGLHPADFRRLIQRPRAMAFGALGQLLLLPLTAFAIAHALRLPPTVAIGLLLIAACPGGVTSNALAKLARGDAALSVSLTALSSCLAFLTIPVVVDIALRTFAVEAAAIRMSPGATLTTLFSSTVLPIALGMSVLRWRPNLAESVRRPLLLGSTAVLMLLVAGLGVSLFWSERDMGALFWRAAPAVALLIAAMTAVGVLGARSLGLSSSEGRTIAIEIGMQNFNLAMVVALQLLQEPRYVGVAIVYLPLMFVFAFALMARRGKTLRAHSRA